MPLNLLRHFFRGRPYLCILAPLEAPAGTLAKHPPVPWFQSSISMASTTSSNLKASFCASKEA